MLDVEIKMTAATDVGLVRTNNEDNFIVNPDLTNDVWIIPEDTNVPFNIGPNGSLMVVADGMGGMNAGEVASMIAITSIQESFRGVSDFSGIIDCSNHIESFMKKAIVKADSDIKKKVNEDPSTSGMGTTIVMAWIIGNVVHIAWCGDSRAYLFNQNSGLSRLSRDHSYVQELVDSGKLDPERAFDHPNSNIITKSLGDFAGSAKPDYMCRGITSGDVILLCSDGLCGLVRDDDILDILISGHETLDATRDALFQSALDAGGYDNITIALAECVNVDEPELTKTLAPTETVKPRRKNGLLWFLIVFVLLAAAVYALNRIGIIQFSGEAPYVNFVINAD